MYTFFKKLGQKIKNASKKAFNVAKAYFRYRRSANDDPYDHHGFSFFFSSILFGLYFFSSHRNPGILLNVGVGLAIYGLCKIKIKLNFLKTVFITRGFLSIPKFNETLDLPTNAEYNLALDLVLDEHSYEVEPFLKEQLENLLYDYYKQNSLKKKLPIGNPPTYKLGEINRAPVWAFKIEDKIKCLTKEHLTIPALLGSSDSKIQAEQQEKDERQNKEKDNDKNKEISDTNVKMRNFLVFAYRDFSLRRAVDKRSSEVFNQVGLPKPVRHLIMHYTAEYDLPVTAEHRNRELQNF